MARKRRKPSAKRSGRIPKVRLARPKGRPIQVRYFCSTRGREVRISTGTRDEAEAEQQLEDVKAKLRLGIDPVPETGTAFGPRMAWTDFREEYRKRGLNQLGAKSAADAESRLDIAERIVKPRTLGDVADRDTLERLQAEMLAGAESRANRPRSPHTVRSHMAFVLAALHWAARRGWLASVPEIEKPKTSKLKAMKGRPIATEEFERMLARVPFGLVGLSGDDPEEQARRKKKRASRIPPEIVRSWRYVLRGLWTSALRLDELMHVAWDDPNAIHPVWRRGRLPVLRIPAGLQKNATEEEIPLLPWFEAVLKETPPAERTGWAFRPRSLQAATGRKARHGRLSAEWVGKVVSRIGHAAGVIVDPGAPRTGRPAKFASAHDLRRSCAERMVEADVPEKVVTRVLRHASWETTRRHYAPGDVQRDAGKLRQLLGPAEMYPGTNAGAVDVSQYTPQDSNLQPSVP